MTCQMLMPSHSALSAASLQQQSGAVPVKIAPTSMLRSSSSHTPCSSCRLRLCLRCTGLSNRHCHNCGLS